MKIIRMPPAGSQAAQPAQPKRVINLTGISTAPTGGPSGPLDPCATAQRLLALGHPKEAQPWLDKCNQQKTVQATTTSPQAILAQNQTLLNFYRQQYAQNPNPGIATLIGKLQQSTADAQAQVQTTEQEIFQDPNAVAQQTYADAIAQGVPPDQAAMYAQTAATNTAADNSQQSSASEKNKQQLIGAAGLGAIGYALLKSNPVGLILGGILGFFAPDLIAKFKSSGSQNTTSVTGEGDKTDVNVKKSGMNIKKKPYRRFVT
jgi:F0F1-type ATP synthase assembly protein I